MNDRRIHRAGLFTLTLPLGALCTDILDRFGSREKIAKDTNPGKLTVDHPVVIHGAGNFAQTATDAEIPSGLNQGLTLGIRDILHSPSFLVS
jgi:hypothetical protein